MYLGYNSLNPLLCFAVGVCAGLVIHTAVERIGSNVLERTIVSLGLAIALTEIVRVMHRGSLYLVSEEKIVYIFGEFVELGLLKAAMFAIAAYTATVIFYAKFRVALLYVEEDEELAEIYGLHVELYKMVSTVAVSTFAVLCGYLAHTSEVLHPYAGFWLLTATLIVSALSLIFSRWRKRYELLYPMPVALLFVVGGSL